MPHPRELFDLPEDVAYFDTAYMAPQLRAVSEVGRAAVARKEQPWTIGVDDFFGPTEEARRLVAGILGCSPDCIALVPSVSYGMAVVSSCLPLEEGQEIVVGAKQFPSNVYPWRAAARRSGGRVVTIERDGSGGWTENVLGAIGSNTAIVALPHCHWTDGSRFDLELIGDRCRKVGAALVLDLTQSLGAMPLRLEQVQPDFVVAAAYKWLFGPYSVAFLYVAENYHGAEPFEHNWINRLESEDLADLVDYRDSFQPGARRFDVGEKSNFVLMPMAVAALRQIQTWGVDRIAADVDRINATIATGAEALGLVPTPVTNRSPHMLGIQFPGGVPESLTTILRQEEIYASVRGDSLRLSFHLHLRDRDVERLLETLAQALKS